MQNYSYSYVHAYSISVITSPIKLSDKFYYLNTIDCSQSLSYHLMMELLCLSFDGNYQHFKGLRFGTSAKWILTT